MKSPFVYFHDAPDPKWAARFDRIVQIPTGIATKDELLEILAGELDFPEWFGNNWDALEDCLSDLSWLSGTRVLLLHHDLPLASNPTDQQIYLELLTDVTHRWQADGDQLLAVAFPKSTAPGETDPTQNGN